MQVTCQNGHVFELTEEFIPLEGVIACIAWCKQMMAKPEYAGLVLECEGKIVWARFANKPKPSRKFVLRRKEQLDLFLDTPLTNEPESDIILPGIRE